LAVKQAGGVVLLGNRVVLRKTANGEYLFPKGHLEPGETAEQTAIREVAEETGLEARIVASVGPVYYTYLGDEYEVEFFLMRAIRELPNWQDHLATDTVTVPRGQVHDLLSFDNYRQLWTRAQRLLWPA
jgi:8-oxo-dGTP pyrophosphatase MutT (NUDIX family)